MSKLEQQLSLPRRALFETECDGRVYLSARMSGDDKKTAARKAVEALQKNDAEKEKRGRGRPKSEETKPWIAAGISKATWFRRQKKDAEPEK